MPYGTNTVLIEYSNLSAEAFTLELNPLYVFRDYHSLFREDPFFDFYSEQITDNKYKIYAHYGAPPVYFIFDKGVYTQGGNWYRRLEYPKEMYRGLDYQEDAKSIGLLKYELKSGEKMFLAFTTDERHLHIEPEKIKADELVRQKRAQT